MIYHLCKTLVLFMMISKHSILADILIMIYKTVHRKYKKQFLKIPLWIVAGNEHFNLTVWQTLQICATALLLTKSISVQSLAVILQRIIFYRKYDVIQYIKTINDVFLLSSRYAISAAFWVEAVWDDLRWPRAESYGWCTKRVWQHSELINHQYTSIL